MRIDKLAQVAAPLPGAPGAEDLAAIRRLSRAELEADQVYTFALRLCDDQVDRDDERFTPEALERLAELFVGRPGLYDHEWSAKGQFGRIYRTEVVEEPETTGEDGGPGHALKAYAYLLRTPGNEELIAAIEGGIRKEVSVGCAVARRICSLCGHDIGDRARCQHVKGQVYDGRRCVVRLEEPTDAYEWSLVAVPAQRRAGIVKGLAPDAHRALSDEDLRTLEAEAAMGRRYAARLREDVVRMSLLAGTGVRAETLRSILARCSGEELEELRKGCRARLDRQRGPEVQLPYGGADGERQDEGPDTAFVI